MDLGTLLRFTAERFPDNDAILDGDLRLTYTAWDARVDAVAHALRARGIGRGDRFVLYLKNCQEWLTTYFALQRLGAIAVPINFRFAGNEVRYCLDDSGAAGILFEPATRAAVLEGLADLPGCRLRISAGADVPAGAVAFETLADPPAARDLGSVDAEGDLTVSGRVDDMIISGGENIHPVEVEDVLARHPHVLEAAVVGTPDEKWGQKVTAFIVPADPSLTAKAIDAFCGNSRDLAPFKRPREIVFVRTIPKTASGKILRRLLRDGQYEES